VYLKKFAIIFAAAVVAFSTTACRTIGDTELPNAGTVHTKGVKQTVYQYGGPDDVVHYAPSEEFVSCSECPEPEDPEPAIQADLKIAAPVSKAQVAVGGGEEIAKPATPPQTPAPVTGGSESPAPATSSAIPNNPDSKEASPTRVPITITFPSKSSSLDDSLALTFVGHLDKGHLYRVTGYTDDKGNFKYNERLALKRANAVAELLKNNGYQVESSVGMPKCCFADVKGRFTTGEFERLPKELQNEIIAFYSRRAEIEDVTPAASGSANQPTSFIAVPATPKLAFLAMGRMMVGAAEPKAKKSKTDPVKSAENLFKLSWGKNIPSYRSFGASPVDGLYEVVTDGPNGFQIFYFAPPDKLIIGGNILATGGTNLTEAKLATFEEEKAAIEAKNSPPLSSFPLDDAVTIGAGPTVIIEASDPDCPYCRKAEDYFADKGEKVTRHIFLTALPQHKEAPAKVKYILCAEDKAAAYREILSGKFDGKPPEITTECESRTKPAMARIEETVQKLGVRGTPLFFIPAQAGISPRKISGINEAQLNKALNGGK